MRDRRRDGDGWTGGGGWGGGVAGRGGGAARTGEVVKAKLNTFANMLQAAQNRARPDEKPFPLAPQTLNLKKEEKEKSKKNESKSKKIRRNTPNELTLFLDPVLPLDNSVFSHLRLQNRSSMMTVRRVLYITDNHHIFALRDSSRQVHQGHNLSNKMYDGRRRGQALLFFFLSFFLSLSLSLVTSHKRE